jgi:hypothetical protein
MRSKFDFGMIERVLIGVTLILLWIGGELPFGPFRPYPYLLSIIYLLLIVLLIPAIVGFRVVRSKPKAGGVLMLTSGIGVFVGFLWVGAIILFVREPLPLLQIGIASLSLASSIFLMIAGRRALLGMKLPKMEKTTIDFRFETIAGLTGGTIGVLGGCRTLGRRGYWPG